MKALVKFEKEVEIKTVHVEAHVRHWEDATINGVEDTEGKLTPCRKGELWCPIIDIDTGIITNWKKGTTASIHFKVVDSGSYFLKGEKGETVLSIENDYVPGMLCPEENGYGDYIIMEIDTDGFIQGWSPDIEDFQKDEE